MQPALDIHALAGPVVVTLVYLLLYYGFQVHQARVRIALSQEYRGRSEKFDRYFSQDRRMLAADRLQLNMLEHMPPFLALLWLNALLVGPTGATIAGAVYVLTRLLYPLMMGTALGRIVPAKILAATVPGYLVLLYLMGALVVGLLT